MSVYFITAREIGRVKIGHAVNSSRRLWELQTASSCKLRLEAVIPGGRREERELHAKFSSLKVRGEWFSLTPQIEELIAASKTSPAEDDPAPATRRRSKKRCDLEDEPWVSPWHRRQVEKYAQAVSEIRSARTKQRTLELDTPVRRSQAA